jgi:hypothetical protein
MCRQIFVMDFRHLNSVHKNVSLRKLLKYMRSNSESVCLDDVQSTCLMMSLLCTSTCFVSMTAEDSLRL